jgi:homeobox protein cut-like
MQSYREDSVTSQLNPLQAPSSSSSRPLTGNGNSADDMGKWRARYEESMNPFEAFRGREATRAYHNLNVIERGVLVLTRAILSNRRTRTVFIVYAAGLHVFCMYLIYESSTMSGSQLQRQPLPYQ